MSDLDKCQKAILGYLVNTQNHVAMRRALVILKDDYFFGDAKKIWRLLSSYYLKFQGILTLKILREAWRTRKTDEITLLHYEDFLTSCIEDAKETNYSEFLWFVDRISDSYKETKLQEILAQSNTTLQTEGFTQSRDYFLRSLGKIESLDSEFLIDADIREEMDDTVREMIAAKDPEHNKGNIFLGFPNIDAEIGGLRPGDTALIAAWTGAGKTTALVNICVHNVFEDNKNVVFVTTETIKPQVRRRLLSCLAKSRRFNTPIPSHKLKTGQLTSEDVDNLGTIKKFIEDGEHGHLVIVQAPINATMGWLRGKILECEAKFPVDLVLLDDLRNIRPSMPRRSEWEEFNDLLKDFKALARTHAGRGVPIISPYQVTRDAYKKARENGGHYDLSALSSSAEAERTSDFILSLWEDLETRGNLTAEILKFRDGRKGGEFKIRSDFENQSCVEVDSGGIYRSFLQ